MQYCGMQVKTSDIQFTDTTVINYINEIKTVFEQQIKELTLKIYKLKEEAIDYKEKYLVMKERHDRLVYWQYGRRSERFLNDEKQQLLFTTEAEEKPPVTEGKAEELTEVKSYSRKKRGRKPIDSTVRRVDRIIDLPEEEKTCKCGARLTKIGEEVSEKVHIIPADVYAERIRRLKYACRCCEGTEDEDKGAVRIPRLPPSMIPRSIVTASLLSYIMTHKFVDHIPYYRQEKQLKRIGIRICRQDMANWQQQSYKKVLPLLEIVEKISKSGTIMLMDETTMNVMREEGRDNTQKSYIWLARGGPPGKKVVIYKYHETRKAENAIKFLEGFKGYLQTDGYDGYDKAVRELPGIIHVGCLAHARRKIFEVAKLPEKSELADEGLKYIRKLYELESKLRSQELSDKEFLEKRKEDATPILTQFHSYLLRVEETVPPLMLIAPSVSFLTPLPPVPVPLTFPPLMFTVPLPLFKTATPVVAETVPPVMFIVPLLLLFQTASPVVAETVPPLMVTVPTFAWCIALPPLPVADTVPPLTFTDAED